MDANQHIFCSSCIKTYQEFHSPDSVSCPVGRENISLSDLKVARFVKNILGRFNIKCRFWDQCSAVSKIDEVQQHERSCEFRFIKKCPNNCGASVSPFGDTASEEKHNCVTFLLTRNEELVNLTKELYLENENLAQKLKETQTNDEMLAAVYEKVVAMEKVKKKKPLNASIRRWKGELSLGRLKSILFPPS